MSKEQNEVATATVKTIPFDFNLKRTSKSFTFDDMVDQPVTIEGVRKGRKDPEQRFIDLDIDGRRYMISAGDLNESKGFHDVVDADAKAKGELLLQPGAVVSSINNTISWRLVG